MDEKKKGKNIISRTDAGDHIVEKRKVLRRGMKEAVEYDLKIPKTPAAAETLYGAGYFLSAFIATLRTDSDDQVEAGGKPASEGKAIKTAYASADEVRKAIVKKILRGEELTPEEMKTLNAAKKEADGGKASGGKGK